MTALPNYPNVIAITARRAKITAAVNSVFPPLAKDADRQRELAEAEGAPMAVDVPCVDAPQWQDRDGNGRIIRKADRLPPLVSQTEIDDEFRGPGIAAWLVMFAATTAVVVIMTAFDWLVGAM